MSLTRFLSWWFAELRALLPGAGGGSRKLGQVLRLAVGEAEVIATHLDNGRSREAGRVSRTDARSEASASGREALAATVQTLRNSLDLCEVEVSSGLSLRREVTLPAAAEENLRQVLGFEMERQTPFRADAVYYDYAIVERDRKNRQLSVELRVVPRAAVDGVLGLLGALRLEQVPVANGAGAAQSEEAARPAVFWFRPEGAARRGRSWAPTLAVINVALLIAVLAVPIVQQKDRLRTVQAELDLARRGASRAADLQARIDEKRVSQAYVTALQASKPAMVRLIEELSERIPDDTSLTRLEFKGTTVTLQGLSQTASSLIATLEESDYLSGVRFSSPVVRQGRDGQERFHLQANIEVPPPSFEESESESDSQNLAATAPGPVGAPASDGAAGAAARSERDAQSGEPPAAGSGS